MDLSTTLEITFGNLCPTETGDRVEFLFRIVSSCAACLMNQSYIKRKEDCLPLVL